MSHIATIEDHAAPLHTSITHRLFHGASIYIASLAIGKGFTVVLQIVLGRWLGPSNYGLYSLGYSVIALVSWIAVLGLDQGVLRYCSVYRTQDRPDKVHSTLWRALVLAGAASVITAAPLAAGSFWIAKWFFTPAFAVVLAGFAIALPFLTMIRLAGTYLQSIHDIFRMSVMQLLARPLLNIAILSVAILFGWGLKGAVGAFVLCCIATACLGAHYIRKKQPRSSGVPPTPIDHSPFLRYSLALMMVGLSYQVILRFPQVLLGHLGTTADVGVYSAGASFALAFGFMTLTFLQPAMPMMVELYETKQTESLRRLYQSATRWTLAVVMPVFLGLCLFSSEVILLFGKDFKGAGPVLLVLSLGWLVYYGKGPGSGLLEMTGRHNWDLANTAGAAVLTVVANYFAIPRYGAMGAAYATAGSTVGWALTEYFEVLVLYKISPWSKGAVVNISGAAATSVFTICMRPWLAWRALALADLVVYGTFYYLALRLEPDDCVAMAAVFKQMRTRVIG